MSAAEPPEIRILRGNPTPEEEEAARRAIFELWREEQARAARERSANAWVLSGRLQGARRAEQAMRARGSAKRGAWGGGAP